MNIFHLRSRGYKTCNRLKNTVVDDDNNMSSLYSSMKFQELEKYMEKTFKHIDIDS